VGLSILYGNFIQLSGQDSEQTDGRERLGTAYVVRAIAYRTIGLLAAVAVVVIFILPGRGPSGLKTFFAGVAKAAHWIAVFWLVRRSHLIYSQCLLTILDARGALGHSAEHLGLRCRRGRLLPPGGLWTTRPASGARSRICFCVGFVSDCRLLTQDFSRQIFTIHLRCMAYALACTAYISA
jgi:hypothetical protein